LSADPIPPAVSAGPPPGTTELPARRACLFSLGGLGVAVDVAQAREVVVLDRCTAVPGAPDEVLGVTNLRGAILPVVEVRPLLGLPARPPTPGAMAIVLVDGDWRAALVIDRIHGLAWFDEPEPLDGPPGPVAAFATGVLAHDGERRPLLDAARLLRAVRRRWSTDD
jgi:purine-binding chemotaxis protein CheW